MLKLDATKGDHYSAPIAGQGDATHEIPLETPTLNLMESSDSASFEKLSLPHFNASASQTSSTFEKIPKLDESTNSSSFDKLSVSDAESIGAQCASTMSTPPIFEEPPAVSAAAVPLCSQPDQSPLVDQLTAEGDAILLHDAAQDAATAKVDHESDIESVPEEEGIQQAESVSSDEETTIYSTASCETPVQSPNKPAAPMLGEQTGTELAVEEENDDYEDDFEDSEEEIQESTLNESLPDTDTSVQQPEA